MLAQEHQREMLSAQARFEEEKQQLIELHASDRARWERLLREEEHKTTLVKDELTVQGKQNESMRDVYNDEKAKIQKENDTLRKHIEVFTIIYYIYYFVDVGIEDGDGESTNGGRQR